MTCQVRAVWVCVACGSFSSTLKAVMHGSAEENNPISGLLYW